MLPAAGAMMELMNSEGRNWRTRQSLKLRFDKKRSASETIADRLTSRAGSMTFLLFNLTWFCGWLVTNSGLVSGIEPFDPYPFVMLTTLVSLEAIALSILVLMSQNREARIADIREEVDFQINAISEKEITKLLELVAKIAEKQGVKVENDEELVRMLKPVDTNRMEKTIEEQI